MRNIILLAVQGAGKGTVAKKLQEKFGYAHISTGDMFRERAAVGDEFGLEIKRLIDNGIFVSDDILFQIIEDRITKEDCRNGYILDGFPRNIKQAEGYDKILSKLNMTAGLAIELTIPTDMLVGRITGRRSCKKCGKIYNIFFDQMTPKAENICDDCGDELFFREDDANEESVRARIATYHEKTAPILDYYRSKGILYQVDSSETAIAFDEIVNLLNKLGE